VPLDPVDAAWVDSTLAALTDLVAAADETNLAEQVIELIGGSSDRGVGATIAPDALDTL
jgi:hypothetical protein